MLGSLGDSYCKSTIDRLTPRDRGYECTVLRGKVAKELADGEQGPTGLVASFHIFLGTGSTCNAEQ